jgi:hypothetical protein
MSKASVHNVVTDLQRHLASAGFHGQRGIMIMLFEIHGPELSKAGAKAN